MDPRLHMKCALKSANWFFISHLTCRWNSLLVNFSLFRCQLESCLGRGKEFDVGMLSHFSSVYEQVAGARIKSRKLITACCRIK